MAAHAEWATCVAKRGRTVGTSRFDFRACGLAPTGRRLLLAWRSRLTERDCVQNTPHRVNFGGSSQRSGGARSPLHLYCCMRDAACFEGSASQSRLRMSTARCPVDAGRSGEARTGRAAAESNYGQLYRPIRSRCRVVEVRRAAYRRAYRPSTRPITDRRRGRAFLPQLWAPVRAARAVGSGCPLAMDSHGFHWRAVPERS